MQAQGCAEGRVCAAPFSVLEENLTVAPDRQSGPLLFLHFCTAVPTVKASNRRWPGGVGNAVKTTSYISCQLHFRQTAKARPSQFVCVAEGGIGMGKGSYRRTARFRQPRAARKGMKPISARHIDCQLLDGAIREAIKGFWRLRWLTQRPPPLSSR